MRLFPVGKEFPGYRKQPERYALSLEIKQHIRLEIVSVALRFQENRQELCRDPPEPGKRVRDIETADHRYRKGCNSVAVPPSRRYRFVIPSALADYYPAGGYHSVSAGNGVAYSVMTVSVNRDYSS